MNRSFVIAACRVRCLSGSGKIFATLATAFVNGFWQRLPAHREVATKMRCLQIKVCARAVLRAHCLRVKSGFRDICAIVVVLLTIFLAGLSGAELLQAAA